MLIGDADVKLQSIVIQKFGSMAQYNQQLDNFYLPLAEKPAVVDATVVLRCHKIAGLNENVSWTSRLCVAAGGFDENGDPDEREYHFDLDKKNSQSDTKASADRMNFYCRNRFTNSTVFCRAMISIDSLDFENIHKFVGRTVSARIEYGAHLCKHCLHSVGSRFSKNDLNRIYPFQLQTDDPIYHLKVVRADARMTKEERIKQQNKKKDKQNAADGRRTRQQARMEIEM